MPDNSQSRPFYQYGYSRRTPHVAVRRVYNRRADALWIDECDRLARRLRADMGLDTAPDNCSAAAQTVDNILLEFSGNHLPATHVFEVGLDQLPFAAIAVRLDLLQDPEAGAVVICGFIGKQLSSLPVPEKIPVPAKLFRTYQSTLFLAFLAGWISRRGYSGKFKMAVRLLSKNPGMVSSE